MSLRWENLAFTKSRGTIWRRQRGCGWFCGRWSVRVGRRRSPQDTGRVGYCWCGRHGRSGWRRLIWQALVLMQVMKTMLLELVCIGAGIGLYYRSALECIGIVLVNVLASVLARIENIGVSWVCICTYHYFIHTKYQPNTCQSILVSIHVHANTCPTYCGMYWVCIGTYWCWIHTEYEPNTCQYEWFVLNTYLLALNKCWYVFNMAGDNNWKLMRILSMCNIKFAQPSFDSGYNKIGA